MSSPPFAECGRTLTPTEGSTYNHYPMSNQLPEVSTTLRPEDLDRAGFDAVIGVYRNLFHHRTVIAEGIRQVACRNMIHLTEARVACAAHSRSLNEDDWIGRVQAKMLADQGLVDSKVNRTVIGWATFYPVQVYLALLYAEIEYIQRNRERSGLLEDKDVFSYFDRKQEAISKLKGFRTAFLHPVKPESASLESDYLAYGQSYNGAPEMQNVVDEYLYRLRGKLIPPLTTVISNLPKLQRLHCLARAFMINFERMVLHQDLEGMEHVVAQMKEITAEREEVSEEIETWSPTAGQKKLICKLSDHLNVVSPSIPEQRFESPATRQPAMDFDLLAPLFSGSGGPECYGDNKVAKRVVSNAEFIARLLTAAGILLHEGITGQGELPLSQIRQMSKQSFLDELDTRWNDIQERGLQAAERIAAPNRVCAALLYEPLRLYAQMEREDASVRDDTLSGFMSRMEPLGLFRNSVFHVQEIPGSPIDLDTAMVDPPFDVGGLYCGLAAFFGPLLRDQSSTEAT